MDTKGRSLTPPGHKCKGERVKARVLECGQGGVGRVN